jgi:acyl dehydratase
MRGIYPRTTSIVGDNPSPQGERAQQLAPVKKEVWEENTAMPSRYDELMALKNFGQKYAYTDREVMLYAYGIGMGADPMDEQELAFVNEAAATPRALKVVPTFASVAAWGAGPGEMNLNRVMVVDGERDITFHRPLAIAAHITADSSVIDVFDKGKDKGAVIRHKTVLRAETGEQLATLVASRFARGDGGFGGPSEGQPEPHQVPGRAPDKTIELSTRPDQALVYRLCGDRNPLHSDPEFARRAGFPRPILHGMCTYGLTCRGVLQTYADYDPGAFRHHVARFSAPVYPGETVTMALWKDGNVISFEARVRERNVTVIKNGKTVLG